MLAQVTAPGERRCTDQAETSFPSLLRDVVDEDELVIAREDHVGSQEGANPNLQVVEGGAGRVCRDLGDVYLHLGANADEELSKISDVALTLVAASADVDRNLVANEFLKHGPGRRRL